MNKNTTMASYRDEMVMMVDCDRIVMFVRRKDIIRIECNTQFKSEYPTKVIIRAGSKERIVALSMNVTDFVKHAGLANNVIK